MQLSIQEYTDLVNKMCHLTVLNRNYHRQNVLLTKEILEQKHYQQISKDNLITMEDSQWGEIKKETNSQLQIKNYIKKQIKQLEDKLKSGMIKSVSEQKLALQKSVTLKSNKSQSATKIKKEGKQPKKKLTKEQKIDNIMNFLKTIKKEGKQISDEQIMKISEQNNLIQKQSNRSLENQYGSEFFTNKLLKQIKNKQNRKPISCTPSGQANEKKQQTCDDQSNRLLRKIKKAKKKQKSDKQNISSSNFDINANKNPQSQILQNDKNRKQKIVNSKKSLSPNNNQELFRQNILKQLMKTNFIEDKDKVKNDKIKQNQVSKEKKPPKKTQALKDKDLNSSHSIEKAASQKNKIKGSKHNITPNKLNISQKQPSDKLLKKIKPSIQIVKKRQQVTSSIKNLQNVKPSIEMKKNKKKLDNPPSMHDIPYSDPKSVKSRLNNK